MNEYQEINLIKLRGARNLVISSFFAARNTYNLTDFFSIEDINEINKLTIKARGRFETYKGAIDAVNGITFDKLSEALITSFIGYIDNILLILHNKEFNFSSYKETSDTIINEYFIHLNFEDHDSYKDINRNTQKIFHALAKATNVANAYLISVEIAKSILISIPNKIKDTDTDQIIREISFPPELTQAGIGLLNYFSVIVEQKYPNLDVTVTIKQQANNVTLIITLPDGNQEEIIHTLNSYGLVLSGNANPESIFDNKIHSLALKHKLELAKMEVAQVREILALERNSTNAKISTLESEVTHLRQLISKNISLNNSLNINLTSLINNHVNNQGQYIPIELITLFSEAITEKNEVKTQKLLEELHANQPRYFNTLIKVITDSAMSGIIGNSAYNWLLSLITILPK